MSRTACNAFIFSMFLAIMVVCAGCSKSDETASQKFQHSQESNTMPLDRDSGPAPDTGQPQPMVEGPLESDAGPGDTSQGTSTVTEPLGAGTPYSAMEKNGPLSK